MPPTCVHFNGSVNLPSTEDVLREIAVRVPRGVDRVPDGETGDRRGWIGYQLPKLLQTSGLEEAGTVDLLPAGYDEIPQVRISDGVGPEEIRFPDLGYASAYRDSYKTFARLQAEGVLPATARFQVQYPTPLASVASWFVADDQERVEPYYESALFADLDGLVAELPHEKIAVQWDVAVEFHLLDRVFNRPRYPTFESLVQRLARAVEQVPVDVPVGLHLCYGDNGHRHFKEPESLGTQVRVVDEVSASASRTVNWFSFTVPQEQRNPVYFEPLRGLRTWPGAGLYFGIVPYRPSGQALSAVRDQVDLIDEHLGHDISSHRVEWGISTECGLGRAERADVPELLDLHSEILRTYN